MSFWDRKEVLITSSELVDDKTIILTFTVDFPLYDLRATYPDLILKGHIVELPTRKEFQVDFVPVLIREFFGEVLALPL